eukprot:m.329002 g.329002  ORF g.329002 m.329002 type:complete len:666 (+) comp16566_c0_seq28:227-2224(+)
MPSTLTVRRINASPDMFKSRDQRSVNDKAFGACDVGWTFSSCPMNMHTRVYNHDSSSPLLLKLYIWFPSRKRQNQEQHALNGNTSGSSSVWIKLIRDGEEDVIEEIDFEGAINVSRLRKAVVQQMELKVPPHTLKVYPVGTAKENLSEASPLEAYEAVSTKATGDDPLTGRNPLIVLYPKGKRPRDGSSTDEESQGTKRSKLSDHPEAKKYWTSLPEAVPSAGEAFAVHRLGGWADEMENIYVRECYTDLADEIFKCRLSAIIGTPGIGKSLFLQYFITYLRSKGVTRIVLARPIQKAVYIFNTTDSLFTMDDDVRFYASYLFNHEIRLDENTWFLYDATSSTQDAPPIAAYNMVVATSTKKDNCQQYMKTLIEKNRTGKFYMPVWSFPEIESVCIQRNMPIDELVSSFRKWGGVARFLLGTGDLPKDEKIKNAVRMCSNLKDLQARVASIEDLSMEDCHLVLHMTVQPKNYKDSFVMWASENIEEEVMKGMNKDVHAARVSFVKDTAYEKVMATARGQTFEPLAHKRLIEGGQFRWKELGNPVSNLPDLQLPKHTHQSFHKLDEIKSVDDDTYYEPDYRTFPAIDSAIKSKLFQMTVGLTHPIHLEGCQKAVTKFIDGKAPDFIFCVPPDVYDQWENPQNFVKKNKKVDNPNVNIRQMVMCVHI